MKCNAHSLLTFAAAIVAALVVHISSSHAVVLFSDTFDRGDSRNIDVSLTGITDNTGSSLVADGVYSQPFVDPNNELGGQDGDATNGGGAQILSSALQLAVGAGTSNAFVNHNFTNASILTSGAFQVSLDITGFNNTSDLFGGAFAVGMTQSDALLAGDAYDADPNNVKFTNAFPNEYTTVVSDFWVGLRGNGTLAWGNGPVGTGDANYHSVSVGSKTGTISANFGVTSFALGSTVNYEVFFNGASMGVGTFDWTHDNENYIGIDARDGTAVTLDNFTIETSIPPATPTLTIDRATGNITLTNDTSQPLSMTIYSITSELGGFNQANWSKIESQGIDIDDTWLTLTDPSSTTDISEATLGEYTLGASGSSTDSIDLGNAWVPSPFEDLEVEVRDAAGNDVPVNVLYVGNGGVPLQIGDFNANGIRDAGDWPNIRDNLVSDVSALDPIQAYVSGDLNSDGMVDKADFRLFKEYYEQDNGLGSFASMLAVPEPTSAALVLFGLVSAPWLRRRCGRGIVSAALLLCVTLALASGARADVLFADSFDRPDSRNIDGSLTGITNNTGTSLPADGVYSQPHVDPVYESTGADDGDAANGGGADITSGQLRLAVGPGTSNAYVNHNFINGEILSAGGFKVSLDVTGYAGTTRQHGGGFALGMTQAEAASAGDAYNYTEGLNMTGAYNPDPYGVTGQPVGPSIVSDFWVGIRGNNSLAWGSRTGDVLGLPQGGLAAKTGSLSVTFAANGFNTGDNVAYEVFYNGSSQGYGVFAWSDDMANYIGLDSRDGTAVSMDNFAVETVTDASINMLRLQVNTVTGTVAIAGGELAQTLDYYEIQSDMGLVESNFTGLAGAGLPAGDGSGNGWEAGGQLSSSLLLETYLQDSSTIAAGASALSLGQIYNTSLDTRDIQFYYDAPDGTSQRGFVEYISTVTDADFDADGDVDLADLMTWQRGFGVGATQPEGDADFDGDVDADDLVVWQGSAGALGVGLAGVAVPEPSAVLLASAALALFGLWRNRGVS